MSGDQRVLSEKFVFQQHPSNSIPRVAVHPNEAAMLSAHDVNLFKFCNPLRGPLDPLV
jgi:hypothetical protein